MAVSQEGFQELRVAAHWWRTVVGETHIAAFASDPLFGSLEEASIDREVLDLFEDRLYQHMIPWLGSRRICWGYPIPSEGSSLRKLEISGAIISDPIRLAAEQTGIMESVRLVSSGASTTLFPGRVIAQRNRGSDLTVINAEPTPAGEGGTNPFAGNG